MIRRYGREIALQMLYGLELHSLAGQYFSDSVGPVFSHHSDSGQIEESGTLAQTDVSVSTEVLEEWYEDYLRLMDHAVSKTDPAFEFARTILEGVLRNRGALDVLIQQHSKNWRLNRMSLVDRNILRIGVFELFYCPDIPGKVAINEAIELAKKFSTNDAVSFINGVLDAVLKEIHVPVKD